MVVCCQLIVGRCHAERDAVEERSGTVEVEPARFGGGTGSENVGISSTLEVKTLHTVHPRVPGQRNSSQGEAVLSVPPNGEHDGEAG